MPLPVQDGGDLARREHRLFGVPWCKRHRGPVMTLGETERPHAPERQTYAAVRLLPSAGRAEAEPYQTVIYEPLAGSSRPSGDRSAPSGRGLRHSRFLGGTQPWYPWRILASASLLGGF